MSLWLRADNEKMLLTELRRHLDPIPARGMGQTTEQSESWTMAKVLHIQPAMFGVDFPCEIYHEDCPDFRIVRKSKTIWVEVVEAIQEKMAHSWACQNRLPQENPCSLAKPRAPVPRRSDPSLSHDDMWDGREPEQEWVACITDCLINKIKKAENGNYGSSRPLHLLVYDDIAGPPANVSEEVAEVARNSNIADRFWAVFDGLHILDQESVWSYHGNFSTSA